MVRGRYVISKMSHVMEPVDQIVDLGRRRIVDPFHGHLTALRTRYDHIVGSGVELVELTCFLKLTAHQVMVSHWISGPSIFAKNVEVRF